MAKIIADGIKSGLKKHVEAFPEDGSVIIEVNYADDPDLQEEFDDLIQDPPGLAGTYYPDPGSMLAAFAVLKMSFFDEDPEIEVDGDIGTIPTYDIEDIVY